jgi:Tfp pilus assembly protein PilO
MSISNEKLFEAVKKNPIITGSVVCILIFSIAMFVRLDALDEAQAELDQVSADASRYATNLRNAAQLNADQASLSKKTAEIETRMLKVGALMENQQFFFDLETSTGVKLVELRPGTEILPNARKGSYAVLPYSLTVNGSYAQLLTLIRRLEKGPQFVRILSSSLYPAPIEATSHGDTGSTLVLTLNLEVLARP